MNQLDQVIKKLESLGVTFEVLEVNAQSYTVDDHVKALGIKYREGMSTLIYKVGDDKFIAILRRDDRNIDSKMLKRFLGTGNFAFCGEDDLKKLGFNKGLVSPILLDGKGIRVIVENEVLDMTKIICGSTSPNHAIEIQKDDLLRVIGEYEVARVTIPNARRQDSETGIKKRILTGDRPTGKLHLGHYVGSLKNRVMLQKEYETFIMLADVQALTDNYDNPEKVRDNILNVALDYLSVGIDPKVATIFIQSMIPEIAELTVFFMNLVSHNEVLKNPTVKTEIKQKGFQRRTPFGFVAYPVSQAADILSVRADLVPVGIDQAPMIELADTIGQRFNKIYNKTVFNRVSMKVGEVERLIGTDGNAKMSKSLGNTIFLSDSIEEVKNKVKVMYTDPSRIHPTDPGKVEGNPVFIYHDIFNPNKAEVDDLKDRYRNGKVGDVEVKTKLATAINNFLEPLRERRIQYENNPELVMDILREGTRKTQEEAKQTMDMVREAMKIKYL